MMDGRCVQRFLAALLAVTVCVYSAIAPADAQGTCSSPSGTVGTNADIQSIFTNNPSCTSLQDDLTIGFRDCSQPCEVSDLSLLNSIATIVGSLTIQCCPLLTDLNSLNSLGSVTSLSVYYNQNLTTISGFQALPRVGGAVVIAQNPKLQTVSGFNQLSTIDGYLEIDRNTALTSVSGLMGLTTIQGNELISGHALSVIYNTGLTSLAGFRSLTTVSYGTVRIEGNRALCYAGYPQWGEGEFVVRTGSTTEDKGIDWRTLLLPGINEWQYTWGVVGGGYPTLLIQNNALSGSCVSATCDSTCQQGAGCLGPNDPNTCGSCTQVGGVNTCDLPTLPPPPSPLGAILGVVLSIVGVIALVLLGLGIWGCVVIGRRYNEQRQGSFDINVRSVEDGIALTGSSSSSRFSSAHAAEQIATVAEPTTPGSIVTRKGVQAKPKLDNIIVSSYRMSSDSPSVGRAPPTEVSYRPTSQNSGVTSPARSSGGDHPLTAKKAPRSLSSRKSEPVMSVNMKSSESNLGASGREPSTEDILARLREEQAEIPMNFPWEQIKMGKEFGTGDFGKVYHGEAKKLLPGQKKTTIVVKQLKEGANKDERDTFLRPVEAMKLLQHPNVLSLLGVSMRGPSIIVMLEYCSQGNFKTFLVRKRREAAIIKQTNQLVGMACDMAGGLSYLHSMNIAHNDFAARSCLVTSEGKVKLGDYGITRQTFKEDYYSRKPNQRALPIRWMAPELIVLQGRNVLDSLPVSMPGNIWSFGVSLWEVCSFAQWPYDDMSNEEVLQTLKTTGKCILENPLVPTDHIAPLFDVCQSCWQSADLRPSMATIYSRLQDLKTVTPTERRLSKTNGPSPRRISQGGGPISGGRSKSQSTSTLQIHHDSAQRRSSAGQPYKPRRPAPKKPTPNSQTGMATFPRTRGRKDNVEEPLVISNPANIEDNIIHEEEAPVAIDTNKEREVKTKKKGDLIRKRTESTEALLASIGSLSHPNEGEFDANPLPAYKTTPTYTDSHTVDPKHVKAVTSTPKDKSKSVETDHTKSKSRIQDPVFEGTELNQNVGNTLRSSPIAMDLSLPDYDDNELPLPQDMVQAVRDEQAMGEGPEDSFILDPPQRFSQSSFDDIVGEDDFVGVAGGVASGISFQFDPDEPDTSQDQLAEQAMGGAPYGDREYTGYLDSPTDNSRPSERRHSKPKDKTKTKRKKSGDKRIVRRQKTPANLAQEFAMLPENEFTTSDRGQTDPEGSSALATGLPNPLWSTDNENEFYQYDEFGSQFDEFGNQFDEFDKRDAMEEDELPNVVLDEDVAALIW